MQRLWATLEAVPGSSAIMADWRRLLQDEFEIGRQLLRPTNRLSTSYPCPRPGGVGCPRRVIQQGDGFVAVCGDEDGANCDDMSLQRGEVVIHELNRQGLANRVASALGIRSEFALVERVRETFWVGDFNPVAGKRFPIFLMLCFDVGQRAEAVAHLCRITTVPFVLLAPTPQSIPVRSLDLLRDRRACFYPLSDLLVAGARGQLVTSSMAAEAMTAFRAMVLPEPLPDTPGVCFHTPFDATWRDLRICFLDGHRVTLSCKGIFETVNFSNMGMENKTTREPTLQWTLLEAFAKGRGKISWHSSEANRRNVKRVQRLNDDLGRFFGISGRPVTWKAEEDAYCTAFDILLEADKPMLTQSTTHPFKMH
ncbi:MAG: hypothetical protein HQL63_15150 [Magnetococcales bacterium]|nr:hypothetical protein [Magnetococcales bacterium]